MLGFFNFSKFNPIYKIEKNATNTVDILCVIINPIAPNC